jgi:hypothetical protein
VSDQDIKAALKEAIKEWMDEKVRAFGLFSLYTIGAAGIGALFYFILTMNGWKH